MEWSLDDHIDHLKQARDRLSWEIDFLTGKGRLEIEERDARIKEELMSPSKTPKQAAAMRAAAAGKSTRGIPKAVGKEFVKADKAKAARKK